MNLGNGRKRGKPRPHEKREQAEASRRERFGAPNNGEAGNKHAYRKKKNNDKFDRGCDGKRGGKHHNDRGQDDSDDGRQGRFSSRNYRGAQDERRDGQHRGRANQEDRRNRHQQWRRRSKKGDRDWSGNGEEEVALKGNSKSVSRQAINLVKLPLCRVKEHAALVLLTPTALAEEMCNLFAKHNLKSDENEGLVHIPLPLPQRDGELLRLLVSLVSAEALETSLGARDAQPLPYICGAGANPNLFRWLVNNRQYLNSIAKQQQHPISLLSTVERSYLPAGYPNCDVVVAACHGTVEAGEKADSTAVRELREEARVVVDGCDLLEDERWLPPIDALRRQTVEDQRVNVKERGGELCANLRPSRIHVFCRIVPQGCSVQFQPDLIARDAQKGKPALVGVLLLSDASPDDDVQQMAEQLGQGLRIK